MYPILLKLGPITIYSYGFFLALAYLTASMLAEKAAKKKGIAPQLISNLCLLCLISGVLGARIFFITLNLSFFKENPREIIMLQHGGLVWYGGLISALTTGLIYIKIKKQPLLATLDLVAPYLALAQAIGRIGCFFNGCCYGKPWPAYQISYPTQIISFLVMFFAFLILSAWHTRNLKSGSVFFSYLAIYSAKRFFIEFLRGDSPIIFLGLTMFQLISIGIFIATLILWRYQKSKLHIKNQKLRQINKLKV